jgi:hypothetical protein
LSPHEVESPPEVPLILPQDVEMILLPASPEEITWPSPQDVTLVLSQIETTSSPEKLPSTSLEELTSPQKNTTSSPQNFETPQKVPSFVLQESTASREEITLPSTEKLQSMPFQEVEMVLHEEFTSPQETLYSVQKVIDSSRKRFKKVEHIEYVDNDDGQYQVEIIEAECNDCGELQIIEIVREFDLVSHGKDAVKPIEEKDSDEYFEAKDSDEYFAQFIEKGEVEVLYESCQIDTYCTTLLDSEVPEFDENGDKKIFRCAFEKCEETFSRRQQAKTHFYNHLETCTNYVCKYCGKKFKDASGLENHERVHTKTKVGLLIKFI